jgi:hypothetical protein
MKTVRFSESQIIGFLRNADYGARCRSCVVSME